MDECFSGREGQGWAKAGNAFEVKKGCLCYVLDMWFE